MELSHKIPICTQLFTSLLPLSRLPPNFFSSSLIFVINFLTSFYLPIAFFLTPPKVSLILFLFLFLFPHFWSILAVFFFALSFFLPSLSFHVPSSLFRSLSLSWLLFSVFVKVSKIFRCVESSENDAKNPKD